MPGRGGAAMHRYVGILTVLTLIGALAAGCSSEKEPAQAALNIADEAVSATRMDGGRWVPDEMKALESALQLAKDMYAKGNYERALSEAQQLPRKAKDVQAAAAAKKAELTRAWEGVSAGMPRVVEAIQSRVDVLSQAKTLPANLTPPKLTAAKAGLAELRQSWIAANEAFKAGNLSDAVAKATAMKPKSVEVLGILGMPVPDALKS